MDNLTYTLHQLPNGNNYLTATPQDMTVIASYDGDNTEPQSVQLDITHQEYVALSQKAITHTLTFDTMTNTVIATPKDIETENN
jgi:hypothetical protein